jgi:nitronate monooxygenase
VIDKLLGVRKPLVLAPMGFVSGGALAAAVSNAGGLGLIGAGYGEAPWIDEQFRLAKNARVGVGFITWSLARQPELLDRALAHKPCAVMLSFGDPAPFAAKVRAAGAKLILQVQDLETAREALRARPDAIVAQGTEAGGHGGHRSLFALLPAVKAIAGSVPVIAAGGISAASCVKASLALGAEGVLVGTRFLAADESLATPEAKARVVQASGDNTLRTTVFDIVRGYPWPARFPARALRNAFSTQWHGREADLKANLPAELKRYGAAVAARDYDVALVFAGEGVDLVDDVPPAAKLVERLCP